MKKGDKVKWKRRGGGLDRIGYQKKEEGNAWDGVI